MIAELRTFVAIARYGTFARAADKVGLTQAAVSAQMKRLEDHLGFPLFERTGRSAALNAAGTRTLPRAQAVLALFDTLATPDASEVAVTLRVGAIASIQSSILARALVTFRQLHPTCGVHVFPGVSMQLVDQIEAGELDLAILVRPLGDLPSDLAWHSLRREPYVLIAHEGCEGENWRDLLKSQPFLRYHSLSTGGQLVTRFIRSLPFTVNEASEVPLQAMLTMVRNGLGVALIPVSEAHLPLQENIRAFPLDDTSLFREIGFVRPRNDADPIAQHLTECLIQSVDP